MRRVTQTEMAEVLEVKQPTISKYMTDKLDISAKDAIKLNREFNIPVEAWENPVSFWDDARGRKDTAEQSRSEAGGTSAACRNDNAAEASA